MMNIVSILIVLSLFCLEFVSGQEFPIPITYECQQQPLEICTINFVAEFQTLDNGNITRNVSLDLVSNQTSLYIPGIPNDNLLLRSDAVFLTATDGRRLQWPQRGLVYNSNTTRWVVQLGANFVSNFMRAMGGYMIVPTSEFEGLLILNPYNTTSHVFGGELFYTESGIRNVPVVSSAVTIVPAQRHDVHYSNSFTECVLDTMSFTTFIPRQAMVQLIEELERLGLEVFYTPERYRVERSYNFITIRGLSDTDVGLLPTIEFTAQVANSQLVNIQLRPQDYLVDSNFSYGDGKHILVSSPLTETCIISGIALRRIAMHFDVRNRRIGFGEPLVELP